VETENMTKRKKLKSTFKTLIRKAKPFKEILKHIAEKHPHSWTDVQIAMENKKWVPLSEVEKLREEIQALCFDKEHLVNCAACKAGIFCNAPIIGSNILGLTKKESLALIKKVMGSSYPWKEKQT